MALTKSFTFSLRRKRILLSNNNTPNFHHFDHFPTKRRRFSILETLPQDILVKVICGVNHDDLKHLFLVSKTIRDATLIAKWSHFAYRTPEKGRVCGNWRNSIDLEDNEAPNAPKFDRKRNRTRIGRKMVGHVSVVLFGGDEQSWLRRSLFF